MVEMRRVELLSENISTALSPSASDVLSFAPLYIHQQIYSFAIPLVPCGSGNFHRVFPYVWYRISGLRVNRRRQQAADYAAIAKLLLFLAFIFKCHF